MMEMEESDSLKLEMLRTLLKRFLILFLRIYKDQKNYLPSDNISVGMIREFNYLVERNYRDLTKGPLTMPNYFTNHQRHFPIYLTSILIRLLCRSLTNDDC